MPGSPLSHPDATEVPTQTESARRAALRDEVFRERVNIADFSFGEQVAEVFDDMLDRSVPFYAEIQRMIGEIAIDFGAEATNVYDLGCSTGNTLLQLDATLPSNVRLIGIDYSREMLERCRNKLRACGISREHELLCNDLNEGVSIENASMVVMMLTLQFVRPLYRDALVRTIYNGLNENGCLVLVEKVLGEDSFFNRLFIKYYYDLKKRHGYSEMEIAQKREALENVLVPYRLGENREMLLRAGFRHCDIFFKWYNFSAMIAVK